MKTGVILLLFQVLLQFDISSAEAFLVAVPDNATLPTNLHSVAPADGAPWDHIGNMVGTAGSGIYLGHGWVMTANHVAFTGTFELNGTTYSASGSTKRITDTDLKLFQLDSVPPEPGVRLRRTPVADNEPIIMIGYGFVRGSAELPLTVPTAGGTPTDGYAWSTTPQKGWGRNQISSSSSNFGAGTGIGFTASFDDPNPGLHNGGVDSQEAIATTGDSGSGTFTYNAAEGNWELAGITFGADFEDCPNGGGKCSFYAQPGLASTSAFLAADVYRNEILSIVPEPTTFVLLGLAVPVWMAWWRRRA